jgi:hypothetical protein
MLQGVNNTSQLKSSVTFWLTEALTFAIAYFSDAMVHDMFLLGN